MTVNKCPKCGHRPNPRTLEENSLSHVWYMEIAYQLSDTPENVKAECKLRFGVPILRVENEEFREQYDRLIKQRFTYEEKLDLMKWFPVTSLMTKGQMARYLNDIQAEYASQGVILEAVA